MPYREHCCVTRWCEKAPGPGLSVSAPLGSPSCRGCSGGRGGGQVLGCPTPLPFTPLPVSLNGFPRAWVKPWFLSHFGPYNLLLPASPLHLMTTPSSGVKGQTWGGGAGLLSLLQTPRLSVNKSLWQLCDLSRTCLFLPTSTAPSLAPVTTTWSLGHCRRHPGAASLWPGLSLFKPALIMPRPCPTPSKSPDPAQSP